MTYIMLSEMKRNWTDDFSWYSWLVSKSQTVLWLAGEPLKDNFQLCTHGRTNKQINLIDCWTATFAVKKYKEFEIQVNRQPTMPSMHSTVNVDNDNDIID